MSRDVILCGGRNHPPVTCRQRAWLDGFHEAEPFAEVIVGSADGAALEGQQWARARVCRTEVGQALAFLATAYHQRRGI